MTEPASGFMSDAAIAEALKAGRLIRGVQPINADDDWQGAETQVQASSVDLRPACFYVHKGGKVESRTSVTLEPGGAVLIHTKEEFDLPCDVMGFVSTPTHWSLRGFFSPSVGHIDPGYKGKLTMVGINMGGKDLELSVDGGKPIASIVLYRLPVASAKDRDARKAKGHEAAELIIKRFAEDFGNFREEARRVARDTVLDQAMKWLPAFAISAVVVISLQLAINGWMGYVNLNSRVGNLEGRMSVLEPRRPSETRDEQSESPAKGNQQP